MERKQHLAFKHSGQEPFSFVSLQEKKRIRRRRKKKKRKIKKETHSRLNDS